MGFRLVVTIQKKNPVLTRNHDSLDTQSKKNPVLTVKIRLLIEK